MSFCEHCKAGHVLPGEPKGSLQGTDYFSSGQDSSYAIVLLTDAFGLPVKNSKIIADQLSEQVGCDVWVPDMFNGNPPFVEGDLVNYLPEQPGKKIPMKAMFGLIWTMISHLPRLVSNRPSVLDSRIQTFVRKIREEKKYKKVGAVGYCMGGAACIRLASTGLIDSAVVAHPGICSKAQIRAMRVPTAWVCAEEDMSFGPKLRSQSEAIFAARKDKPEFIDYEFHDFKGTVHGFAARPNLGIPEIKEAFEKALDATVKWFKKTLH